MTRIKKFIILALIIMLSSSNTVSGDTERHHISWAFLVYAEPDFKSAVKGRHNPQTVTVIEKNTDGWALIGTYNGNWWVYLKNNSRYINRKTGLFNNKGDTSPFMIIAPQVVRIAKEEDNWLQIETQFGQKWINLSWEPSVQDRSNISNARKDWYFVRNSNRLTPRVQTEIDLKKYGGYYIGDTKKKELYLTFDNGYENGLTAGILDTLKEKKVPAAFFVVKSYIDRNPELIKRMVNEGHLVCNHSNTHKNFPDLTGKQIEAELNETAKSFKTLTGKEMPRYFRPPSGVYSERVLAYLQDMDYKTIFWSSAYMDWDVRNQPGKAKAEQMIVDYTHNGAIILLHAISKSNAEALGDALDKLIEEGYVFKSLDDLPG